MPHFPYETTTQGLVYSTSSMYARDKIIKEPLYKGMSKSAEGYSAQQLMAIAKEEGINIEKHWQYADTVEYACVFYSILDVCSDTREMI